jgi:hypothetical protein
MQNIFTLLFCVILIFIAYYDFKYRALPVYLLVIAIVFGILVSISRNGMSFVLYNTGVNALLISIQLSLTTLYFSARNRKFTNIFSSHLGMGDVIFFLVIILSFSPLNFILFIIISGFITILFYAGRKNGVLIPLAGSQAVMLCTIYLSGFVSGIIQPFNDLFLIDIFFN